MMAFLLLCVLVIGGASLAVVYAANDSELRAAQGVIAVACLAWAAAWVALLTWFAVLVFA